MSDVIDAAAETAIGWLRAEGPLTTDVLVERLVAAGHGRDDAEETVEWLGEYGAWHVGVGLLVHGASLIEGKVFTHRLTEPEVAHECITDEEDIALLVYDLTRDETTPLVAGGGMGRRWKRDSPDLPAGNDGSALIGPDGWLSGFRAGELVAFTVRSGAVALSAAEPEELPELSAWLRDAYEREKMSDETAFIAGLAIDVLVHHPEAFTVPRLPITELVAAAGLSRDGDCVAPGDFDWAALWERRRDESGQQYAEEQGLDEIDGRLLHDLAVASVLLVGTTSADGLGADVLERARVAFTSPAATEAFMKRPIYDEGGGAQLAAARLLAEAVLALDPSHAPAGAHWVLGRLAECEGDVAAHQQALAAAVRADPTFAPALLDQAMYASDAGDAGRAVSLLDRVGRMNELFEYFAGPGPARAGRNEPCPCGSGAKYKVCCGPHNGHPLDERCEWLLDKLRSFVRRPPQWPSLEPLLAAVAAGAADEEEATLRGLVAVQDTVLHDLLLFEGGLAQRYLEVRGHLLPADERELLAEWTGARHRVAHVVATDRGAVELEDPATGKVVELDLGDAEPRVRAGDVALVLELDDGRFDQFGSVCRLDPAVTPEVTAALAGGVDLEELAPLVLQAEVERRLARAGQPRPSAEERRARLRWLFLDARDDDDPDDDDVIAELVEEEHGFELLEAEERERLHLAMHGIVARQLIDGDPPEVWETAQRLESLGIDQHELLHMIGSAVAPDIYDALRGARGEGEEAYLARLDALPGGDPADRPARRRRGRHRR